MGGDAALSDEVTAIRLAAWQICCYIASAVGAKRRDLPPQPKPPDPGWKKRAQEAENLVAKKAANWFARHPELVAKALT